MDGWKKALREAWNVFQLMGATAYFDTGKGNLNTFFSVAFQRKKICELFLKKKYRWIEYAYIYQSANIECLI